MKQQLDQTPHGLSDHKLELKATRIGLDLRLIAIAPHEDMPVARKRAIFAALRDVCQQNLDALQDSK